MIDENKRELSLLAHRGRVGRFKGQPYYENHLVCLNEILKYNPPYIEVDTRNLVDGTILLAHDPVLKTPSAEIFLKNVDKGYFQRNEKLKALYDNISFTDFLEKIVAPNEAVTFIIDVKDYAGPRDIENYCSLIEHYHLFHRVMILSWNVKFILDFNRYHQSHKNKVQLGISIIPYHLSPRFFPLVEAVINTFAKSVCKRLFCCNLDTLEDKRLLENGRFPWFFLSIKEVRETLDDDIFICFSRFFVSRFYTAVSRMIGRMGVTGGLYNELKKPTSTVMLWDFNNAAQLRTLTPGFLGFINTKRLVLFSSILDEVFKDNREE